MRSNARAVEALDGDFDVVIIGGGATGLGAAVDAASRGYATALIEARDFANATSSRSTKLIHGGVRYLEQGNIALVREALRERSILRANAPHLVSDLGFLVPAYRWYEAPYYGAGLFVYDVIASFGDGFGRSRYVGARAARAIAPGLRAEGLRGAIRYHDGQFDDARLALALARTALGLGAVVVNYARAVAFEKRDGRITGVRVRDEESGAELTVRARCVLNATGIFSDELRRMDDAAAAPTLRLSRGSHVVARRDVWPSDEALLVPRTDDGRVLFVIPWHGYTLIGTTDLPEAQPSFDPKPSPAEIAYMLEHASRYLQRRLDEADVTAAFCGLRPLIAAGAARTAQLSREHLIETAHSGLVTIAGGKWTTYRKMAQDAIDAVSVAGGLTPAASRTAALPLFDDRAERAAFAAEHPELQRPLHPQLPYTLADAAYAVQHEMARTVDDVLARRTRATFLNERAAAECRSEVERVVRAVRGER